MMTVKELKEALDDFNDDDGVAIWFIWNKESVLDMAESVSRNGHCIQINTESARREE
jgi:hypothetical protein